MEFLTGRYIVLFSMLLYLCFLLRSFVGFDRLLTYEYKNFNEFWIRDGKPHGLLCGSPELGRSFVFFSSTCGRGGWLFWKWLFSTPEWAKRNNEILNEIFYMRRYFVISIVCFLISFFVMILNHQGDIISKC